MIKLFFSLFLATIFLSNAYAISDEDLGKSCLETGKAKIATQAEAYGCAVDLDKVVVDSIDNRWYNPSKYVWYRVPSECKGSNKIVKLVQYSNGECESVPKTDVVSISDDELAKKCFEVGRAKIADQAKSYNCSIDLSKVEVQSIDNRKKNPSKYVWYQVKDKCNNLEKIVKLVQYSNGMCDENASLKAVVTVIQNSTAVINKTPKNEAGTISDKPRSEVIDKTDSTVNAPSTDSSTAVSK